MKDAFNSLMRAKRGVHVARVAMAAMTAMTAMAACGTHVPVPNDANTFVARQTTEPPRYVLSEAGECVRPTPRLRSASEADPTNASPAPAPVEDDPAPDANDMFASTDPAATDGARPSGPTPPIAAPPTTAPTEPPPAEAAETGGTEAAASHAGGGDGTPATTSATTTITTRSSETPAEAEGTPCVPNAPRTLPTTVTLHNGTIGAVCYVYFSQEEGRHAWGEDRLGPAETIASGESRDFRVAPGLWRMRATDCNRTAVYQRDTFEVPPGGGTVRLMVRE